MEWPGKLSVQTSQGKASFSPGVSSSTLDATTALAAEVLLEDTLDGFLAQHLGRASTRVLGRGYPDPTRPGKLCGVVTLHGIQAADVNSAGRTKQYWFDMNTNRLVRAVHAETGAEVRFVEYASSQGNEFPTKIQVFQGGTLSVTYVIVPAGVSAQANDGLFGGN